MKPNLLKLLPLTPYLCRYGVGPLLRRRRLLSDAVALPKEPQSNKIFWSQNGQGRFFINELFAGQKKGVFIDVGANDGITFSNTYALEQIGWTGICIEPHPDIFLKLRGNRSCECICAAAVDGSDASSLEFWKL